MYSDLFRIFLNAFVINASTVLIDIPNSSAMSRYFNPSRLPHHKNFALTFRKRIYSSP
jgi:hypothetical protein